MCTAGICSGYFTCYGSIHIESPMSWRTPFIIQACLGATLAAGCLYLPNSPRWLLVHGRREEALQALDRLDIPQAEAEKDILRPTDPTLPKKVSFMDILTIFKKEYRPQALLALFILGIVQLCGIDGVLYVSNASIFTAQHQTTDMTSSIVRSNHICSSRTTSRDSILPSIRRLSNSHLRSFHPSHPLRRSLGTKSNCHHRRRPFDKLHVHYWMPVRHRKRAPAFRTRQMGCNSIHFRFRSNL